MLDYLTVKEAGEKWNISGRMVTVYCNNGKIKGAVKRQSIDFKNPSTQLEQSIPSPEEVIRKTFDCLTRSRRILLEIEELLK